MDFFELRDKLKDELKGGQTIENLVEYVLCDYMMTTAIITKYFAKSINIRKQTQRRLIKEFIEELA